MTVLYSCRVIYAGISKYSVYCNDSQNHLCFVYLPVLPYSQCDMLIIQMTHWWTPFGYSIIIVLCTCMAVHINLNPNLYMDRLYKSVLLTAISN